MPLGKLGLIGSLYEESDTEAVVKTQEEAEEEKQLNARTTTAVLQSGRNLA